MRMIQNQLRFIAPHVKNNFSYSQSRLYGFSKVGFQNVKTEISDLSVHSTAGHTHVHNHQVPVKLQDEGHEIIGEIFPTRVVPMMLSSSKEPVVMSFDEVPGPKSLKYFSNFSNYLSQIGTQLTAGFLTFGISIGSYISVGKSVRKLSALFDEYGPVVRYVSPIGGDIVLINHPDHIQKVYKLEGDCPVRSTLDCLDRYRIEHRHNFYGGLYNAQGDEWKRHRSAVCTPINQSVTKQMHGLNDVCENFVQKVYGVRNHQDEVNRDLNKEIHKWSFDCLGLIIFSKKFTMLDTETVYSQCDMSWLYNSLEQATNAIIKCETGLHLWKLFPTPAWNSLVKYCDSLDNLIGKHVMDAEQKLAFSSNNEAESLITAMLMNQQKLTTEDITILLMDMLLLGVNTISSTMSFLLYHIAKHQSVQKILYEELGKLDLDLNINKIKEDTPYLQACIKETLRLVPPIPVLTRILPKNIVLDRYNIPRGTLIIMSTQDAALKDLNYDDASLFHPERWLKPDAKDYHSFASIPFGFGSRKCLGQNVAETMLSLLTIKLVQKFKMEYHYGDILPTRTFIARPNKQLKIRFIDRI